jgi:hypothetical protein
MFALNQGEVCTCPSRALVQKSIYDKFIEKAVARVNQIRQGNPLEPATMIGAQASNDQLEKILSYVDIGKKEGAKLLTGGERNTLNGELSEGYYMAREDELYQAALARGSASADEVSRFGAGGGNVTEGSGRWVSIAGKFGMRREEVPAMLAIARQWVGRSVDDVGHRYEQMVPGYEVKEAIMRSVVCMFDSGYTLPQGREVINYYYPLAFGFDGQIYTMASSGGSPKKIDIVVSADNKANNERIMAVNNGARDLVVSPTGKEVAFTYRGDVFVNSVEGGGTKRITTTPETETGVEFAPDGKSLIYASERDGKWGIFEARRQRDAEPYFFASTVVREAPVISNEHQNTHPAYSPDGKELAFL